MSEFSRFFQHPRSAYGQTLDRGGKSWHRRVHGARGGVLREAFSEVPGENQEGVRCNGRAQGYYRAQVAVSGVLTIHIDIYFHSFEKVEGIRQGKLAT